MFDFSTLDWKKDASVLLEPFYGPQAVYIWAPAVFWFVLHAACVAFWKANPKYAQIIKSRAMAADTKADRLKPESHYDYRNSFDLPVKSVAFVHAIVSSIGALWAVANPPLVNDPYDMNPYYRLITGISAGYFFYDFVVSTYDLDPAFIVHGLFSFVIFGHSTYPFFTFYGAMFLVFEISTIFLHPRWFFISIGQVDSIFFQIVDKCFVLAFLGVRLMWGPYMSFLSFQPKCLELVFSENAKVHSRVTAMVFSLSNFILQMLNVWWILALVRSRMRRKNRSARKETTSGDVKETSEATPLKSPSIKGNSVKKSRKTE